MTWEDKAEIAGAGKHLAKLSTRSFSFLAGLNVKPSGCDRCSDRFQCVSCIRQSWYIWLSALGRMGIKSACDCMRADRLTLGVLGIPQSSHGELDQIQLTN